MKRFVTEDSFWQLFPSAAIGIVVAEGMKPALEVDEAQKAELEALLDRANVLAERHLTSDTISENEPVKAWREAYRAFKTKKGARCSIENLLKRVLKGKPVGPITPSVDIYNAISLKYALPVGGEDIDAFVGDLRLTVTEGGDAFLPLGEDEAEDPTLPGELCYLDDAGAVCRCWNWRDGQRTALTDDSRNAFLIIECVEPARVDDCRAAIDELAELVERYLGATIAVKDVITSDHREVVIAQ
ncbi:B3/4 domain-containing protein [Collinsella tanakaei]|uniref:B3/B4 domain-containing protein n=1 Tax=Collinsella tanakaei TaxID=626935 RepID=UPI00195C8F5F|nr:B3/4 domain-containing protein [Collinsella tanakaei]MBM6778687.1 B3/4 domain-containing protein [Collinsella tanakaei]